MPKTRFTVYRYEAHTSGGQRITGSFQGDWDAFKAEIRAKKLTVFKVEQRNVRLKKGKFKHVDLLSGIEELSYLVGSGMKINLALQLIIKNAAKESVKTFWENVLHEIKAGKQFSKALRKSSLDQNMNFPQFYVNVLAVGEDIGELGHSLVNLKNYLQFKKTLVSEIQTALAYPAFLICLTVLAIGVIFGVILPKFASIFTAAEMARLPLISRMVFQSGQYVMDHLTLLALAAAAVVLLVLLASGHLIRNAFKILSRAPFIRTIILQLELANVFTSLGIMLSGGIELNRALKQAANVAGLPQLKSTLELSINEIKKGRRLSDTWAENDIIPNEVVSLTLVGENSAKLDTIMTEVGERYLTKFQERVKRAVTLLEPGIILVMGLVVGFFVTAIALGLVSLNDVVS